jgi:hypothetical protein
MDKPRSKDGQAISRNTFGSKRVFRATLNSSSGVYSFQRRHFIIGREWLSTVSRFKGVRCRIDSACPPVSGQMSIELQRMV